MGNNAFCDISEMAKLCSLHFKHLLVNIVCIMIYIMVKEKNLVGLFIFFRIIHHRQVIPGMDLIGFQMVHSAEFFYIGRDLLRITAVPAGDTPETVSVFNLD